MRHCSRNRSRLPLDSSQFNTFLIVITFSCPTPPYFSRSNGIRSTSRNPNLTYKSWPSSDASSQNSAKPKTLASSNPIWINAEPIPFPRYPGSVARTERTIPVSQPLSCHLPEDVHPKLFPHMYFALSACPFLNNSFAPAPLIGAGHSISFHSIVGGSV